jgi:hypothetical protein
MAVKVAEIVGHLALVIHYFGYKENVNLFCSGIFNFIQLNNWGIFKFIPLNITVIFYLRFAMIPIRIPEFSM